MVADLQRHTTEGRLSLAEFTDRAGRAYRSATHGDLLALTSDLPALPPPPQPARPPRRDQRNLIIALALALLAIAIIGVARALLMP